jgi:hypothetical protein
VHQVAPHLHKSHFASAARAFFEHVGHFDGPLVISSRQHFQQNFVPERFATPFDYRPPKNPTPDLSRRILPTTAPRQQRGRP